jgi:hypothetical protein
LLRFSSQTRAPVTTIPFIVASIGYIFFGEIENLGFGFLLFSLSEFVIVFFACPVSAVISQITVGNQQIVCASVGFRRRRRKETQAC